MTESATMNAEPTNPEPEQPSQADYFGFSESHRHYLPDGVSYIEFTSMNEGQKAAFQKKTSRDLVLEKSSGNARMKVDPGSERWELIKNCVSGWNLHRQGAMVPFSTRALEDFLKLANPRIVEGLELAIRKANPWLMDEMSVEDIQREIDNLEEMKKVAEEREAGEGSSSSK